MKKTNKILSAVLISTLITSCGGGGGITDIKLIPVKSGKEFQYIDGDGGIVINPQFSEATLFRNNLALVRSSGDDPKWGFITDDGKYAISGNYKEATVFSDNLAWVVSENSAPTAIDTKGEVKFTMQEAENARIFQEGLAAYSVSDDTGRKWGFVDKEGSVKINPQFSSTGDFKSGKCKVQNKEGKWGFIDKEGTILINYQFDGAKDFKEGKAIVVSGGKSGLIDENGKYIINPQFSDMVHDKNMYLINQDGKWGWCDQDGKITINPQFGKAFPFGENKLAAVESGGSYGYIDKDGKIAINPQFDLALPFNNGIALVQSSGNYGFIDAEGKYTINPQFDDVARDLRNYMYNGTTSYSSVKTDYFNVGAITSRISTGIKSNSVEGMDYMTTFSDAISKYKMEESDISKYKNQHQFINSEKLSNDAMLNFYVIANPFSGYKYVPSTTPHAFLYEINLSGKGAGKQKSVFKELQNLFSAYKKNEEKSTENKIHFENENHAVELISGTTISIIVKPSEMMMKKIENNKPKDYCFHLNTNSLSEIVTLTISPDNSVKGSISADINDDENGYYASYSGEFTGEVSGDKLNVSGSIEIEGSEDEFSEIWILSSDRNKLTKGGNNYSKTNCR